jgi:hypothetical protein
LPFLTTTRLINNNSTDYYPTQFGRRRPGQMGLRDGRAILARFFVCWLLSNMNQIEALVYARTCLTLHMLTIMICQR